MALSFMPWFFGDYLRDTGELTLEEHGAYMLLIGHMWNRGGELPADVDRLARILGTSRTRMAKLWTKIGIYFDVDGERILQKKVTKTLEKTGEIISKRREAGRLGNLAKKTRKSLIQAENGFANANANAIANGPQMATHPDPDTRSERGDPDPEAPLVSEIDPLRADRDPDVPLTAHELLGLFRRLWETRWSLMWTGASVAARSARMFMDGFPVEAAARRSAAAEIKPALERYFASPKAFYVERKHPFDVFVKDFDSLRGAAKKPSARQRPHEDPGAVPYWKRAQLEAEKRRAVTRPPEQEPSTGVDLADS